MSDNNSWMNAVLVLLGAGLGAAAVMAATSSPSSRKRSAPGKRRHTVRAGEPDPVDADHGRLSEPIPERDQPDPDSAPEPDEPGGGTADGWVYWP